MPWLVNVMASRVKGMVSEGAGPLGPREMSGGGVPGASGGARPGCAAGEPKAPFWEPPCPIAPAPSGEPQACAPESGKAGTIRLKLLRRAAGTPAEHSTCPALRCGHTTPVRKPAPPTPLHATVKSPSSTPSGRGFRHRTQSAPRCVIAVPGHSASLQMAWLFVLSLCPGPPPLISAFCFPNFSFSPCSRALLSATISRPIRLSSWRIIARRYCRPVHKCTARRKPTPAAHKCSLFIVLVMFMVRSMLAGIYLPIAAEFTVASVFTQT